MATKLSSAVNVSPKAGNVRTRSGNEFRRHCASASVRPANNPAHYGANSGDVPSLGALMCRVHSGDADAFATLLNAVAPQWAPYRRWGRSSGATEDLQQELWLTLWQELQHQLPTVLQALCGNDGGDK